MLRKISRALIWTRIMAHSRKGEAAQAITELHSMEKRFDLRPYEEVVKYSLYLRSGQYEVAEEQMDAFVKMNAASTNGNTKYAVYYCKYILNGIRGDLDEKRAAKAKALEVECDRGVKRWLPL